MTKHTYYKYVWEYNTFTGELEGKWVEVTKSGREWIGFDNSDNLNKQEK